MSNSVIPTFDKKITQVPQLRRRLKKLFPDLDILSFRENAYLYIAVPSINNAGQPELKMAKTYCYRIYNKSMDDWNDMLSYIYNDFTFPGHDGFVCPKCQCPDIKQDHHRWSDCKCSNCGESFSWQSTDYKNM